MVIKSVRTLFFLKKKVKEDLDLYQLQKILFLKLFKKVY